MAATASARGWKQRLGRLAPGLPALLSYRRGDFPHDLIAGLSVAAVALPVGVAYAELAGFSPEVGLYASILPLLAYALFGTSRQLIVGPDAATCALVAAAVAPMAGGDKDLYLSFSMALAMFAGVLCIGASFLRLGALADFLSKPILVGFLNGVALSILLGQIGKIVGFELVRGGIVPRLLEFVVRAGETHWPTLAVGIGTYLVLRASGRWLKRLPAALVAMAVAALAVKLFGLEALGVRAIGDVPAGLPKLHLPQVGIASLPALFADAAGLALVSFSSMMLTARSFAAKRGYEIDTDREFAALGAANIAAALSQSFAISGADSRTAMSDSSGGRTQVTGLVAAATIAAVLLLFTTPLQYVPIAALGAVLVKAAFSLVDLKALKLLFRIDRVEFALSLLATLGVVAVGAVQAIAVAVLLALLRFIRLVARPKVEILGSVPGYDGWHAVAEHPGAQTIPGLRLLRFNGPIVFFNAPYFKHEVLAAATPDVRWLVLDMIPVTLIDATGVEVGGELMKLLRARGIQFVTAGRQGEWERWAVRRHFDLADIDRLAFSSLHAAVDAFLDVSVPAEHPAEVA
jgi:high affinity sulfate transporter 1